MLVYDGSWVHSWASSPGCWLCFPACCGCEKSKSVQWKECWSVVGPGCTAGPASQAAGCVSQPAVGVRRARGRNRSDAGDRWGQGAQPGQPAAQLVCGSVCDPGVARGVQEGAIQGMPASGGSKVNRWASSTGWWLCFPPCCGMTSA